MKKRQWLRATVIGGVLLLAASFGFSRALGANAARRYLIAHLAASFGRPVEVSRFDFSLLDGARIEAHEVSVAEDPEFGNEYFLRADTLTVGLRWASLLAGRFEFGSVSLSRPSLNLVRDAEGRWNIERWLPPASTSNPRPGFVGPLPPARAARPARIDISGGRINFKQGDNKVPFALADVAGSVEQIGPGRWQLDLEARPVRAGVGLQDIGTVRLRGSIAGTTARLQPADLNLTWRAGSLADALRLVSQNDYGMRGRLAVDLTARVAPPVSGASESTRAGDSAGAQWTISGVARLTGTHGWRLPDRVNDPSANLSVVASWRPGERHAEVQEFLVELPSSHLQGKGELDWARGIRPEVQIESAAVGLSDVLAWYRAVQPNVADDLRADGALGFDAKLAGWPLQLQEGRISSAGGALSGKSLPAPLKIGGVRAAVSRGRIDVAPVTIAFAAVPVAAPATIAAPKPDSSSADRGAVGNAFTVRGSLFPQANGPLKWPPDWSFTLDGGTPRVQDWLAVSAAFAQPLNSAWSAAGGLSLNMHSERRLASAAAPWQGSIDFLGLTLMPSFINQPLHLPRTHVEFAPAQQTIIVSAAEAFGAIWHGSITRKRSDATWSFDLSADHLDAAELDHWLGPRARPGFLARLTGGAALAASAPPVGGAANRLAARGRLRVASVDVAPLRIEQFDGDTEIDGRTIRVRKAQGDFYGGKVSGSFDARLEPDPSYEFNGRFDRVNLAELGSAVSFLDSRIDGSASATLALSSHGVGRADLVGSLQGDGTIASRNVSVQGLDLSAIFRDENSSFAPGVLASVRGSFRVESQQISLSDFVADNSRGRLAVDGRIDFSHTLDLHVVPSIYQAAAKPAAASPPGFRLSGTLEDPKLVAPSATPEIEPRPRR